MSSRWNEISWGPVTPRRTQAVGGAALVDGVLEHGVEPGEVHARHPTRLLGELGYDS
jgi:hypothetical protein